MIEHPATEHQLDECLSVEPALTGHELVGHDRARDAWRRLIRDYSRHTIVIEVDRPIAGHRIMAFGAVIPVTRAFSDQEAQSPRPGVNARIIASIANGHPVVLDARQLRSANSSEGVDFVAMYTTWRRGLLSPQQLEEVHRMFATRSLEGFSGFRWRRLLTELTNAETIAYAESWRVFRFVYFESGQHRAPGIEWTPPRAVAVSERDDANKVQGSVAALIFQYREPILQLKAHEQRLLESALSGGTDQQLAPMLGVTVATVKKRWASIFDHLARTGLELWPTDVENDLRSRGPQKRQHVLAYVRQHPEELRPHINRRQHR
jgi:hypothetical protein